MSSPIGESLAAMSRYFVGDATMSDTLSRVCGQALKSIEPAVMAGITLTVDAKPGTYIFTHPEVPEMDQAQYDTGDGPCLEAFRTGQAVYVESTIADGAFPVFRAAAIGQGIFSVLSMPMNTEATTVGAINFYAESVDAFGEIDAGLAREFAMQAGYLLVNAQAYWDARTLSENLTQAMVSRAEIEQAKGIIMGATGKSADEAFDELRRQSQYENVKLRDLAHELVQQTSRRRPD